MMVLSYPAPHGPEDAAPQYQNLFPNETTHRTATWNYAPNLDKQWILRNVGMMEPIHIKFTDALHRKRLQTLQSVDYALERLYNELKELRELNNTYIFYTSDHGYHLGQFGLVKGKSMPFDFDIKVPFYVRGPNVPQGISIPNIVLNLDLAPTFLDLAGVDIPDHMDGKSIMKLITGANELVSEDKANIEKRMLKKRIWRDTFLVESPGRQYANIAKRQKGTTNVWKQPSPLLPHGDRHQHSFGNVPLSQWCRSPEYQTPCQPRQKWECSISGNRWIIRKCRSLKPVKRRLKSNCICPDGNPGSPKLDPHERRRQRAFLRDHVTKEFKPQFIGSRGRRSSEDFDVNGVYQLYDILMLKQENPNLEVIDNSDVNIFDVKKTTRSVRHRNALDNGCQLTNNNVNCSANVYNDLGAWRQNKNYVDTQIKALKEKLGELKDIRKHLKQKRPEETYLRGSKSTFSPISDLYSDYDNEEESDSTEDDCDCEGTTFGNKNGKRGGHFRDELREERRRQKHDRKRLRDEKMKRQERKSRRQQKYENYTCNTEKMNCFVHDNDHWKTPPFWTDGPFCFCQNSNNNTYWCLRTINSTHNFLFCEFITKFLSFYDMNDDPYQMRNVINDVPFAIIDQLHKQLMLLKVCAGAAECTVGLKIKDPVLPLQMKLYGQAPRRGRQASSLPGREKNRDSSLSEDGNGDELSPVELDRIYSSDEEGASSGLDYPTISEET